MLGFSVLAISVSLLLVLLFQIECADGIFSAWIATLDEAARKREEQSDEGRAIAIAKSGVC
jgi:hypothetical protein